jgi:hypothetical protein
MPAAASELLEDAAKRTHDPLDHFPRSAGRAEFIGESVDCKHRHFRDIPCPDENIAAEKAKLEAQVAQLKPGPQRNGLLKKIRQLETASHINECSGAPATRTRLEVRPTQLASCPAYMRTLPGVVIRSLPSR